MQSDDPIPGREEVEAQLDRMLASKRFKGALNQAAFLEVVVRRALIGKKTTEYILGRKIFGAKFGKAQTSDVRVTANSLRNKLDEFYRAEGADDPIIIQLVRPDSGKGVSYIAGEPYRPKFGYNSDHEIAQQYRLGLYHLSPKRPHELSEAVERFRSVLVAKPAHIGARVGLAESCLLASFTHTFPGQYIVKAVFETDAALSLAPSFWRAHAASGASALLASDLDSARRFFSRALALDRRQVEMYGWYQVFLFVTGHESEALSLSKRRADAYPENALTCAIHGAFLYLLHRFDEAARMLTETLKLDPNCWVTYLFLALVCLAEGRAEDAFSYLKDVDQCLHQPENEWYFSGLAAYCGSLLSERVGHDSLTNAESLTRAHKGEHVMDNVLLCMAANRPGDSIVELFVAWGMFHPVILFTHRLPLFDTLRDRQGFMGLLKFRLSERFFIDRDDPSLRT